LKNRIAWIVLAGVIVGATLAVVFLTTKNGRPPPGPPPAAKQPDGKTINQATGAALKALSECMQDSPLPQCKQKPMVTFIFSARDGGGRILDLTLVKGWLDPDLFKCWGEKLKKILVPAADQSGKVNVQYPLACDEKGKIHIRPPAWGGSISKKKLPKR
jgi:hypothetical protein